MVYAGRGRWVIWSASVVYLHQELTDKEADYAIDALALASFSFATANLYVPNVQDSFLGWLATRAASAAGSIAMATAPFAAGAAIGATAGTAISGAIWGEEGAQTALGFYSGGLLPGTDAPNLSDYQYIFKPTAPGGPVSLYDVAETGIKGTLRSLNRLWSRRPSLGNPYLI